MVLGNFNSVLSEEDRIGGNQITLAEVVEFRNCVNTCDLIELPNQGHRYIWNDKHSDLRVFSKIDRALINDKWLDLMLASQPKFLPEGISDHCPIQLILENDRVRKKKSFLFCNV